MRCIAWSLCVILPGTLGHPPPLVLIVSFARFIAPTPPVQVRVCMCVLNLQSPGGFVKRSICLQPEASGEQDWNGTNDSESLRTSVLRFLPPVVLQVASPAHYHTGHIWWWCEGLAHDPQTIQYPPPSHSIWRRVPPQRRPHPSKLESQSSPPPIHPDHSSSQINSPLTISLASECLRLIVTVLNSTSIKLMCPNNQIKSPG